MGELVVNVSEVVGNEVVDQLDYAFTCGRSSNKSSHLL